MRSSNAARTTPDDVEVSILDMIIERAEHERRARLKQQQKDHGERMSRNPDPTDAALARVWVVYAWNGRIWVLAGFLRRRNRRRTQTMNRFFARIRRRLQIDKRTEVKIMDLHNAQRLVAGQHAQLIWTSAPTHIVSTRPAQPIVQAVPKSPKAKVRKFRKSVATVFHKRETTFVALGRNKWDRDPSYMYLGPLESDTARAAELEARRTFGAYTIIVVVPVATLSKRLRNAMHTARQVRPGSSRVLWPEPMDRRDVLALPKTRLRDVSMRDAKLHVDDVERRLRSAVKSAAPRDEKVSLLLATLGFLYDLPTYPQ